MRATVRVAGRFVPIIIEGRPDGGLCVRSDDVPGFLLSHSDPAAVLADVLPALTAILQFDYRERQSKRLEYQKSPDLAVYGKPVQ